MYSNYNDKHFNSGSGNLNESYFQNQNYIRENDSPYLNYQYSNPYMNVNTMQMRNNLLKSQYPEIYYDINKIVDDIYPRYRSTNITEEVLNNMTDEILNMYINKSNNDNDDTRNKSVQEKTTRQTENVAELSRRNNILKDLIKIILITRIIKFNLDNTHSNYMPNNYYRYSNFNYNPYDYQMREQYRQNEMNNLYMGYQPRNYF